MKSNHCDILICNSYLSTIVSIACLTITVWCLCGCAPTGHDERLVRVADIVDEQPQDAIDSLGRINPHNLSARNRHYYDFLSIKAHDKAYVAHESDSLILDVISYYSSTEKELYPEALYYGGRVYSDLGDSPTALRYFQMAIEEMKTHHANTDLKIRAYSQTGRLLTSMRLYNEAIPYIKSAIEIEKGLKDTIKIINDLILLGGVHLQAERYDSADRYFHNALFLSQHKTQTLNSRARMYLARSKNENEQFDSALFYIRGIPEIVDSLE